MTDLSLSEAYFMCAVGEKGKLSGSDTIRVTGLMTCVLSEMEQDGLLSLEDKKVKLIRKPSDESSYFYPVYEHLKEMELTDYKHILQDYSNGLSDRHLNALTAAIGTGLADRKLVTRAKLGLFGGRTYYMPHSNTLPALAAELQVDFLFQTPVPEEDILLWMLLDKTKCVPRSFPKETQTDIQSKVTEIVQTDTKDTLSKFISFTDKMLTTIKANTVVIRD